MDAPIEKNNESVSAGKSTPIVDLCDSGNSQICQRIRQQSGLRDKLAKNFSAALTNCADGKSVDCGVPTPYAGSIVPTHKQMQIADQLDTILQSGKLQTSLGSGEGLIGLFEFLTGGHSPTSKAPMRADRTMYWETVSRPYEKQLVDSLTNSNGVITNAQMMQTALNESGNDRALAILTVANFTKNMAAIERRQVSPELIAPDLRHTYTKTKIDSLFNRIEGFADDPRERYNKEGSIYHFYGAMFAASQLGEVASLGVLAYNTGKKFEGRADHIKDAASTLGAQFWWGRTPTELSRFENWTSI
jgi:hypothetical protein